MNELEKFKAVFQPERTKEDIAISECLIMEGKLCSTEHSDFDEMSKIEDSIKEHDGDRNWALKQILEDRGVL